MFVTDRESKRKKRYIERDSVCVYGCVREGERYKDKDRGKDIDKDIDASS